MWRFRPAEFHGMRRASIIVVARPLSAMRMSSVRTNSVMARRPRLICGVLIAHELEDGDAETIAKLANAPLQDRLIGGPALAGAPYSFRARRFRAARFSLHGSPLSRWL